MRRVNVWAITFDAIFPYNADMRQRDSAICLMAIDFSETSQVVHFLTRLGGIVKLLAKGSKRAKSKTGGAIDLLSEGDLLYSSSGTGTLGTLMEFAETAAHNDLRKNAGALNAALYAMELCGMMVAEADPHPEVFDLLHSALARLARPAAAVEQILAYFQWRLLKHVGLLGDLVACVACGNGDILLFDAVAGGQPEQSQSDEGSQAVTGSTKRRMSPLVFSSCNGGFLCPACSGQATDKYPVEPGTLEGLEALVAAQAGKRVSLGASQANAVNRLLLYHISQQLGKTPRMARHAITKIADCRLRIAD
jgi:DNA repair protein RecO (recombination protein O)